MTGEKWILTLPAGVVGGKTGLVDDIRPAGPDAVWVRGIPTLIMADRTGAVVESWV